MKPRLELPPAPGVHADLAPLSALAAADEDRAAVAVEIALGHGVMTNARQREALRVDQSTTIRAMSRMAAGAMLCSKGRDGSVADADAGVCRL